jgi:translation initiation factor IF-1
VEATVVEVLPSGLYRVEADGRGLTAHAARGGQRNFVRVLVGDRVVVEVAQRDPTRGRIMRKA